MWFEEIRHIVLFPGTKPILGEMTTIKVLRKKRRKTFVKVVQNANHKSRCIFLWLKAFKNLYWNMKHNQNWNLWCESTKKLQFFFKFWLWIISNEKDISKDSLSFIERIHFESSLFISSHFMVFCSVHKHDVYYIRMELYEANTNHVAIEWKKGNKCVFAFSMVYCFDHR